jgi:hypothetical protein
MANPQAGVVCCRDEIVPGSGLETGPRISPDRPARAVGGGIQILAYPRQQARHTARHQQEGFLPTPQRRKAASPQTVIPARRGGRLTFNATGETQNRGLNSATNLPAWVAVVLPGGKSEVNAVPLSLAGAGRHWG